MATTTKTITWRNGVNTLLAGTPIDQYGNTANDSTAVGIVTETLVAPNKIATILTSGTWDESISRENGIPLSDACRLALSNITLVNGETPIPEPLPVASLDEAGIVKMAEPVAPATEDAPETTINAVIDALVGAGIMAEYEAPEEPPVEPGE